MTFFQDMQLRHTIKDNIIIIGIEGAIHATHSKAFKQYLQPFLEDPTINGMGLNCQNLQFIDSSALGILIAAFHRLTARNAKLTVYGLNEQMTDFFINVVSMDHLLAIYPDERQALDYLLLPN